MRTYRVVTEYRTLRLHAFDEDDATIRVYDMLRRVVPILSITEVVGHLN